MYTFNISESPKPFYIEIQHNTNIFIGGFAVTNNLSDIMLLLVNSKGEEFSKKMFSFSNNILYNPTPLPSNEYSLLIYLRQNNTKYYYSYIGKDEIIISSNDNILSFHLSPIFASNGIFLNKIPRNSLFVMNCLRHTENYQCNDIQIQRLAKQITEGLFFTYNKIKAIHDWVASHIYYDKDSLQNNKYIQMDKSGLGILVARKGVCSGYSNLATTLLRASGIPSVGLLCYTLHIDTDGGWEDKTNLSKKPNHIITLALANSRWIIMDVTWDSDNIFEDGSFKTKTGYGISNKYFDVSVPFISSTHKFIELVY